MLSILFSESEHEIRTSEPSEGFGTVGGYKFSWLAAVTDFELRPNGEVEVGGSLWSGHVWTNTHKGSRFV